MGGGEYLYWKMEGLLQNKKLNIRFHQSYYYKIFIQINKKQDISSLCSSIFIYIGQKFIFRNYLRRLLQKNQLKCSFLKQIKSKYKSELLEYIFFSFRADLIRQDKQNQLSLIKIIQIGIIFGFSKQIFEDIVINQQSKKGTTKVLMEICYFSVYLACEIQKLQKLNLLLRFSYIKIMQNSNIQIPFCSKIKVEYNQDQPLKDIKTIQNKISNESDQTVREPGFQKGLHIKFQRLKKFIADLGEINHTAINLQLLEQLEIEQEVYQNVCEEVILQEAQKRIEKMIKTRKYKRNWSICDLKILIWIICKHCELEEIDISEIHNYKQSWEVISSLIPGTSAESCLFKWLSLKRHKITLHGWSEEQQDILISLQRKHTESRNKWKYISEELYILNPSPVKIFRHPKQCRQHYASFLDPQIKKGPWTKKEDITLLVNIIENNGQKKWCKLVRILEGRTENAIKNRFQLIFTKLKKKKENKSRTQLELITEYVRQNGGQLPTIKKQRDPAVNNQSPPPSIQSQKSQEQIRLKEEVMKIPLIPTFNYFPSSRSLHSAFIPYAHESQKQFTFQKMYTFPFNNGYNTNAPFLKKEHQQS